MATGFAVAVKLVDLASGPLANINKAIVQLERDAKKASGTGRPIATREALNAQKERLGQIKKTREGLKDLRDRADDVSDSFRKMFGPLGLEGIATFASAGGIALISKRFAELGSEIGRTSSNLNFNTVDLQKWRGAADLAGVGAEAITTSISGLAQGVYKARNGLDPQFTRVLTRWGLDASKGATDAEKGANLLLQVADLFQKPELRGNKQAQLSILESLHIDPRTLYLLDLGRRKLEELMDEKKQHGLLTDQQIAQSFELQHAFAGLTQSVGGFSNKIGADLSPQMTFALQKTTEWIDKLRESPAAMKVVETAGEVLFITAAARWGGALLRLTGNITGLTTALTFLTKIPGMSVLGPIGAFLGTLWGGPLNKGENEAIKKHPELYPTPTPVHRRHGDIFRFVPEPGTGAPGALGAPPGAGQGPRQRRPDQYGGIPGVSPAAFDVFSNSVAGIERARYDQMGGAGGRYAGRYQLGPAEIAETAARLGEPAPTQQQFLRDPAMQERYFANYTLDHNYYLLGHSARYQAMSPGDRLKALGYAHNQGAAGAERYLDTGIVGHDAFGTAGTAYSDAIGRNLAAVGLAGAGAAPRMLTAAEQPAGGGNGPTAAGLFGDLNSKHEVFIDIRGAAPGMRSGLTKAEGPAEVSVRTHYSMDNLS